MSTTTETVPSRSDVGDDEDFNHVACPCSEDVAFCGADMSGDEWVSDDSPTHCVVCADLEPFPCERCGE